MKSPKSKPGPEPPESGGGKALQRLRLFQEQRGIAPGPLAKNPVAPKKRPRGKSK